MKAKRPTPIRNMSIGEAIPLAKRLHQFANNYGLGNERECLTTDPAVDRALQVFTRTHVLLGLEEAFSRDAGGAFGHASNGLQLVEDAIKACCLISIGEALACVGTYDNEEVLNIAAYVLAGGEAPQPSCLRGCEYIQFLDIHCPHPISAPYEGSPDVGVWPEIRSGISEMIDFGTLRICPKCMFLNYAGLSCEICELEQGISDEDAAPMLADALEVDTAAVAAVSWTVELASDRISHAIELFNRSPFSHYRALNVRIQRILVDRAKKVEVAA